MAVPKWVRSNPGKGKHGVPDKGAAKVGKKWEEKQQKQNAKKDQKDP